MRTNQEILEAIKALKNNKIVCERYDYHGNDNHIAIDVMIDVLEKRLTQKQIQNQYPYYPTKKVYQKALHQKWEAATNARQFMDGIFFLSDLLYPEPIYSKIDVFEYVSSMVGEAKKIAQRHEIPSFLLTGNKEKGLIILSGSFSPSEIIWMFEGYLMEDPGMIPILETAIQNIKAKLNKQQKADCQIVEHAKNYRTDN